MTTVSALEAIPLKYRLTGEGYGSSRGIVTARETTIVRLTTSDGAVGWGEAWGPSRAVAPLIEELGNDLVGAPLEGPVPFVATHLQQHYHRGGGLYAAAISGVEIAVWDALGKTLGVSVATLLGGRARDYVTPYASAGYVTPERNIERFRDDLTRAVEGFVGAKIKCGLGAREDIERVSVAREVLGQERALMVDINGNYTADQASATIRGIQDLDVTWLEEALPPDDMDGLRVIGSAVIPLATGEALYTRAPFRRLVTDRLVDIVQPDITKVGGLAEARAICELARAWNVRVSPHIWGGGIALAASLQLLGSIPDYPHTTNMSQPLWAEFDRGENAIRESLLTNSLAPVEGQLAIPDGPGLGVDINLDVLTELRQD